MSDSKLDEAFKAVGEWYRDEIRDLAKSIRDEQETDSRELEEVVHESVDGSALVVYTRQNYGVLMACHADPFERADDLGVDLGTCQNKLSMLAFLAVEADVLDEIERQAQDEADADEEAA